MLHISCFVVNPNKTVFSCYLLSPHNDFTKLFYLNVHFILKTNSLGVWHSSLIPSGAVNYKLRAVKYTGTY